MSKGSLKMKGGDSDPVIIAIIIYVIFVSILKFAVFPMISSYYSKKSEERKKYSKI